MNLRHSDSFYNQYNFIKSTKFSGNLPFFELQYEDPKIEDLIKVSNSIEILTLF